MKNVILRVSPQRGRYARSTRHRRSWPCGRILALGALLLFLGGCGSTYTYRLKQDFDSETLVAVPLQFPNPNPPADNLLWTQQFLQPNVVLRLDASGGRWVRIQAKESYFSRGKARALSAFSDFFQVPGAGIRGHFSIRLVGGTGHVVIALRTGLAVPLGDISVNSRPFNTSDIGTLTDFDLHAADLSTTREEPRGTGLAPYTPGQTLEFFWSINQASQQLNLVVLPGGDRQLSFAKSQDGVAKTPLQRIYIDY